MTKSQDLKFNAIENTDAIVGIDIAKNVHWAGIILPNGKEIKKSFSFNNNKKGFESLVEIVKNVLTMLNLKKVIIGMEPTGHYWKTSSKNGAMFSCPTNMTIIPIVIAKRKLGNKSIT